MLNADLLEFFEERCAEINAYLAFLQNVEDAAREGAPRFRRTDVPITTQQKKILNSSLYLQLYNLVEATISRCLKAVENAIDTAGRQPSELSMELRSEWLRSIARTHTTLGPDKRLQVAIELCDRLIAQLPVAGFSIEAGGGGNWDDAAIERLCKRVGCNLNLSKDVQEGAKRIVRDDMGALKLVKDRRNGLAHGSLSFVECSDGVTVHELKSLVLAVQRYLSEAVDSFIAFIAQQIFNESLGQTLKEELAC